MKMKQIMQSEDRYPLQNGMEIPCIGFGTYNPEPGDNYQMVKDAIEAGYRYFDTASLYGTERALGQAIKDSGIPREEFFLVTKLWTDEMGYENAKDAIARSLGRLQTDYLDLYLIHWPRQPVGKPGYEDWKKLDVETWKALEELVDEGKTRGIGLSNFLPHHVENILQNCRIRPVVDQLELHPAYMQDAAIQYCQERDIQVQAWSPMGRSKMLTDPFLQKMADRYQVTVAQICLRFLLQRGIIPLPKSLSSTRMKLNRDLFGFEISQEDMYRIGTMPPTGWLGEHPDFAIPTKESDGNQ